jgi:hypothetical protein
MPKHAQPDFVSEWKRIQKIAPPKCCHTCNYYSEEGLCNLHDAEPPEEYAATLGECPDWVDEIPF